MRLDKLSHWMPPGWESACKNESRNCAKYQAEVVRLRQALEAIKSAGSKGQARRIAIQALGK